MKRIDLNLALRHKYSATLALEQIRQSSTSTAVDRLSRIMAFRHMLVSELHAMLSAIYVAVFQFYKLPPAGLEDVDALIRQLDEAGVASPELGRIRVLMEDQNSVLSQWEAAYRKTLGIELQTGFVPEQNRTPPESHDRMIPIQAETSAGDDPEDLAILESWLDGAQQLLDELQSYTEEN